MISAVLGLRQYALSSLRSLPSDAGLARAEALVGDRAARSESTAASPASFGSGVNGAASTPARLRAVYSLPDLGAATLEAARSDDPVLWIRSVEMWSLCMDIRIAKPLSEADIANIQGSSRTPDVTEIARRQQEMRDWPPMRAVIPEPHGSMLNNATPSLVA